MRFFVMRSLAGLSLFALAACMGTETPPPEPVQPPAEMAPEPETPAAEAVEVLPPPDPTELIGLNPREVQNRLGDPTLVRREANMQAMLFENGDCVFEVIFYEPDPNEHFKATDTNARTRSGVDTDRATCLSKVLPEGQWLTRPQQN